MEKADMEKAATAENSPSRVEGIKVQGKVRVQLFRDGKCIKDEERPNLITTAGKTLLAKILKGTGTLPGYMAVGDSSTAAAVGQTALVGSELGRVANDSSTQTTNSVAYTATFPAGTGTGTIEEAGIFNGNSGGEMLARFLTGTFTKSAADVLVLTWTITFS